LQFLHVARDEYIILGI